MKNKYFIIAICALVAGFVITSCRDTREKNLEAAKENATAANQDLNNAQAAYEKEWANFKAGAEVKISDNQKRIDAIKADFKSAKIKAKVKYEKDVSVLEQKNDELKKKISDYKYSGLEEWAKFKQGFNRDLDSVGTTISDIFSKSKKEL
jgi:predicted  nucleic acid-binding Zn-ribbon protein